MKLLALTVASVLASSTAYAAIESSELGWGTSSIQNPRSYADNQLDMDLQTQTNNNIVIYQGAAAGGDTAMNDGNRTWVDIDNGGMNRILVRQAEDSKSDAKITGDGTRNKLRIRQFGDKNDAVINMSNANRNDVHILQRGSSEDSYAKVKLVNSNRNDATVIQSGEDAEARITMRNSYGNNAASNWTGVVGGLGLSGATGVHVTQTDYDYADVKLRGNSNGNSVVVWQN